MSIMFRNGLKILLIVLLGCIVPTQAQYVSHSVLSQGNWWKIKIDESGVQKITTTQIPQIKGLECNKIAIWGKPGPMLSLKNSDPYIDDLIECAIQVNDANNNGHFDDEDYILFYGQTANVWTYNASEHFMEHRNHPFAPYNYYFLTTSASNGKRITTQPSLAANQSTIQQFTIGVVIEKDNININKSGQLWVGESFSQITSSRSYNWNISNISNGSEVKIKHALVSLSTWGSSFKIQYGNDQTTIQFSSATKYRTGFTTFRHNGNSTCTLTYTPNDNQATGYIDYLQINALTPINSDAQQCQFYNLAQLGEGNNANITLGGSAPTLWDVTDDVTLVGTGNNLTIRCDKPRSFVAFKTNQAHTPTEISHIDNQDLHSAQPDMVIITHPQLKAEAERLAQLHTLVDNMTVLVATDNEVYNEYTSGRQDPMAIRHLLRTFYKRHEADNTLVQPRYLLLMGQGTYDNKNITQSNGTYLLTYETVESLEDGTDSYCTDDIYAYMHDNEQGRSTESLDLAVGRIPATNASQAKHVVDKIERYIFNADLSSDSDNRGDWRNYVTLLADDADPSCQGDTNFAHSSEVTARQINAAYPNINIDKIYADAYTQQSGAIGSFYPDVNNALRKRINYGTLILNYIGHGSEKYIGTERYMEQSDIEGFTNINKLAFFITSTCSFGHYDNPQLACGAESFLLAKGAGIGVISAARPISHVQRFNTAICINALNPNISIGEALRLAKNLVVSPQCITLFGDPALKLSIPQNHVAVTKINDRDINPSVTDSATVLTEVTIEGEIRNPQGEKINDFDGTLYPIVFDRSVASHTLANDNPGTEVNFVQQKSILYKGVAQITNGFFKYSFVVPRDVAYQYDYGRISHYAHSVNGEQASGSYTNIMFGGFNQDANLTESHPIVKMYIGDTNFVDGGLTNESPTLFATIYDTLGINYFGSGLGHDLVAILDNNPNNPIILNDFYEQDLSNPALGHITYQLQEIAPGKHTLSLRAWNIYNFSGNDTISFVVKDSKEFTIDQLTAYPNPTHDKVLLQLPCNGTSQISQAYIELYSNRGQKILTQTIQPAADSFVIGPIQLNLSHLQKGIYIARMVVNTPEGILTSSAKIVKL